MCERERIYNHIQISIYSNILYTIRLYNTVIFIYNTYRIHCMTCGNLSSLEPTSKCEGVPNQNRGLWERNFSAYDLAFKTSNLKTVLITFHMN